ncbi:uncharacterized protein LOC110689551 [Chenopodium quinoa]|uniref:uncharacterized protein LOC110689551 n=1 Tax=Chenopodium quinoa TaxID=63459 RepID=UPI000B797F84|nr:uncharacterized protein LOC110689551 [Chenopodium quinoa]
MGRKHIQLASFFFLATVMVQMLYVSAQCPGAQCSPTTACCEEFACVNNVCTDCEDHAGHSCDDRECCPELSCLPNPNSPPTNICVNCEEHPGHPCTPGVRECCPNTSLMCVSIGSDKYECQL